MTPVSFFLETIYNRREQARTRLHMKSQTGLVVADTASMEIAKRFVAARRNALPLNDFPGEPPAGLQAAYAIQDAAIELWPDQIGGWKVGRIPVELEDGFGIDRLAGPIFRDAIRFAAGADSVDMPVFDGGFAAIEAEYVAVIGQDAPAGKVSWTYEEAEEMISDLCVGLEIASSPLKTINELGPPVVVSDFGNNAGLIVGPSINDWRNRSIESMGCVSYIDRSKVGEGGAFRLTGGFVRSVQFVLELNAQRGIPLRSGDFVATGQTTGIHDIRTGQTGKLDFGDDGELNCAIVEMTPRNAG
jgi:2-keto-4-pentenoate hydratase